MNIGSHNSMTYLPPDKWWMKLGSFIAKCQSKTIKEQYEEYGVTLFDIRVSFNDKNKPIVSHGLIDYEGSIRDVLLYLNTKDFIKVRIILEKYRKGNEVKDKILFKRFCSNCKKEFRNITFFGGNYKKTWEVLFNFGISIPSLEEKYSSQTWKKLDDRWPCLYAFFMNRKNIRKGTDKDYLFIDFVEIR